MNTEQIPKPTDADADLVFRQGRLILTGKRAKKAPGESAGVLVTACTQQETCGNTGSPAQWSGNNWINRQPVRERLGCAGWRRGPYNRRNRVTPVEGRGLGSRAMQEEAKARRLA